ncbi:hypothetical protein FRC12_021062 [Ceratobasidium sp. 428]|nr:hypothetical protein FRC12_021062 [Ceratobasidium sp. 428]
MTSVQTAPGLPLPTHRSRFLVSASSLRLALTPPSSSSSPSQSSASSTDRTTPVSRRKRFSPVSVTHTTILGHTSTKVVSLGTVDLAAVLRHAASTRTPEHLVRPRTPEPFEEPEQPAIKDTRERPRYRVPPSPLPALQRSKLNSAPRPAPISLVRPRAQFPLYLPILDSRIPQVELPSLESIEAAAAAAQALVTPTTIADNQGRRSARARRPASRTLHDYLSSEPAAPAVPVSRKRRADASSGTGNEKRELRTSKRARKDVNYIIPSLASIDREMGEVRPRRVRRRSEASLSEESESKSKDVEARLKEDSPLPVDDELAKAVRRPRARQQAN